MAIEFQHVTGGWRITDYDSRLDDDAFPEVVNLKGRVRFSASFDADDRFAAIRVPGADSSDPAYALSVRDMVFPVVAGRLQDRQARDGAWLPAIVAGVPIVWTATPELYEDPGRGVIGPKVRADSVTFGPADEVDGERAVNLANIMDTGTEYPEPVISRVAELVVQAERAQHEAASSATAAAEWAEFVEDYAAAADAAASSAAGSELAAASSAGAAAGSELAAADHASAAAGSADAASGAGAARDDAQEAAGLAASSASAAASSASEALGAADSAADSATDAGVAADRAEAAADAAETGAPAGGWSRPELSADVRGSLDRADNAIEDAPATVTLQHLAPQVADAFNQNIDAAVSSKADLGSNGQIVTSQIPALAITSRHRVANRAELLALEAEEGDVGIVQAGDPDRGSYMLGPGDPTVFASWALLVSPEDAVQSVNGQIGPVILDAGDVGAASAEHGHTIGNVSGLQAALDARLPSLVVDELPAQPIAGVLYLVRED